MDELLKKLGLTFEKLKDDEREEYKRIVENLQARPITIEEFKAFIQRLHAHLEKKLCAERDNRERDMLISRLENCIVMLSFFNSPEERKREAEAYILELERRAKAAGKIKA